MTGHRSVAGGWLLVGIALLAAVQTPAALAAQPDEQGWWYLARSSQLPIATPVPPTVADDGLYVAAGPGGAAAVAALRLQSAGDGQAQLVLEITDSSGVVVMGACRTEPWFPVQAGNWDERPAPDCDAGAVTGIVTDDGTSIGFDVTTLLEGGALDVLLIPGTNEDGTPANFTASIARPGPEAITIARGAPPPAPTTVVTPPADPAPTPDAPPTNPSFSPSPVVGPSAPFQPASGVEPLPEPDTGIEIPAQVDQVAAPAPRPLVASSGGPASDAGRLLGLGVVAALGAAFVVLRGRQGPVPAPILSFGSGGAPSPTGDDTRRPVTSGVGRFSKERVGRAPPLG